MELCVRLIELVYFRNGVEPCKWTGKTALLAYKLSGCAFWWVRALEAAVGFSRALRFLMARVLAILRPASPSHAVDPKQDHDRSLRLDKLIHNGEYRPAVLVPHKYR